MDRDKFDAALSKIIDWTEAKSDFSFGKDWLSDYMKNCLDREIIKAARELLDAVGESQNVEDKPPANVNYVSDIKFYKDGTVDVFYNGGKAGKRQKVYECRYQ